MTRLAAFLLLGLVACDTEQGKTSPPTRRSDGVAAGTSEPSAAPAATGSTTPASKKVEPPRKLCVDQTSREAPKLPEGGKSASGAAVSPPAYGEGWVWINVWAAWCEPCKEEVPRLIRWRDALRKKGVDLELVFVSIDDDEREMTRQLTQQAGMTSSLWLADEEAREPFFAALGYEDTPSLPVHAFVSPAGKLTCVVEGALEESDEPQLTAIFGAK